MNCKSTNISVAFCDMTRLDCASKNFGDELNRLVLPFAFESAGASNVYLDFTEPEIADPRNDAIVLGIGTLLEATRLSQLKHAKLPVLVLGSGARSTDKLVFSDTVFSFVRGPLTARCCSLDEKKAITDPAILCAKLLARTNRNPAKGSVGFFPHLTTHLRQAREWLLVCEIAGMQYIDPTAPPEETLSRIGQLDRLVTEAMHGAIVADSLRVPWKWVSINTPMDSFKWSDWLASMNLQAEPERVRCCSHRLRSPLAATGKLTARFDSWRLKRLANSGFSLSDKTCYLSKLEQLDQVMQESLLRLTSSPGLER